MSNAVWLRDRHAFGVSVTSGGRLTNVAGRVAGHGVRVVAPCYAQSMGGVRPQVAAPIAAMADLTPDAQDKGLMGVPDWSPPA